MSIYKQIIVTGPLTLCRFINKYSWQVLWRSCTYIYLQLGHSSWRCKPIEIKELSGEKKPLPSMVLKTTLRKCNLFLGDEVVPFRSVSQKIWLHEEFQLTGFQIKQFFKNNKIFSSSTELKLCQLLLLFCHYSK